MRKQSRPFNRTMFAGLVLIAVSNTARWFLERHTAMPEDPRDALIGLLFGLAIGTLILGLWRQTHTRRHAGGHQSDPRDSHVGE
jgi:hypothetical protein